MFPAMVMANAMMPQVWDPTYFIVLGWQLCDIINMPCWVASNSELVLGHMCLCALVMLWHKPNTPQLVVLVF
jgi:hypothetical protein